MKNTYEDSYEIDLTATGSEDDAMVVFKLVRGRWIEQAPDTLDPDQPVRIRFDGIPLPAGRRLI